VFGVVHLRGALKLAKRPGRPCLAGPPMENLRQTPQFWRAPDAPVLAAPPIENLRPCPILPAPMVQVSHLKALWAEFGSSPPAASFPTVEFYGYRPASGALRCFSNFYEHPPFL
jgi:hypothetical protein